MSLLREAQTATSHGSPPAPRRARGQFLWASVTCAALAIAIVVGAGCASTPYTAADGPGGLHTLPESGEIHRSYLLGDIGLIDPADKLPPVLHAVQQSAASAPASRSLVYIGDNVYCCGLPDSASVRRARAEARLDILIDFAAQFGGTPVFVPGNHDWNDSGPTGPEFVQRMERYVEDKLGEDTFRPSGALPGPEVVELADDVILVAIDTEWWLTKEEKPFGESGDYEIDEDLDFIYALTDVLEKHEGDHVLLIGHHPVYSRGTHNGHWPAKVHLFPLTMAKDNAYLPLPGVGSLAVLATRLFGGRQDLPNRRYRTLRTVIETAGRRNDHLVYASGHEHNMQYFRVGAPHNPIHHIVSGATSGPAYVSGGGDIEFAASELGYATVSYYEDGSSWAAFWSAGEGGTSTMLYAVELSAPRSVSGEIAESSKTPDYADSTVTRAINPGYHASGIKAAVLGSHNRALWTAPVVAPVLDLGSAYGGLTPVKRGGGMQTVSLRLRADDGQEYVLRSLDKDPAATVPVALQGTVATDIVQDQISSINPYGAFAIPPLARAVGVYHTEPQLVFVPDDPRLGPYRDTFGNQLMMLEHRPDDDVSAYDNYGNSRKVVSATKLYDELRDDNDNRIDADAFVRVRLFDMLLGDWDRHRGQWRWARFDDPDGQGDLYRPIPRDRDWVFNRMNGLVSVLAPQFDPKFQSFNSRFGNIKGLSTNGLEQDRRFLAMLTEEQWVATAESIRDAITSDVIEEALAQMPDTIRALDGDRIRRNLLSRAQELPDAARTYYRLIARVVDIVGSDKHERFEVDRHAGGSVTVRVFKTSKEGEIRTLIFDRTFSPSETREIRLFGLGGQDRFAFSGTGRRSINVIAVGGAGKDELNDQGYIGSSGRTGLFVDTDRGTDIQGAQQTRVLITDDPLLNTYNSRDFKYNVALPQLYFERNDDDGFFFGGGVITTRHGFRRMPFASQHRIVANVAARTRAFNIRYAGAWTMLGSPWMVRMGFDVLTPNNIRNYYGLGNETDNTVEDRTYYQARLARVEVRPALERTVGGILGLHVGPFVQFTDVRQESDRFLAQQPGIAENTFADQWFAGFTVGSSVTAVDNSANPKQGARWTGGADFRFGISGATQSFTRLHTDLAFYISPSYRPQVTLALRAGGAHNLGSFPFFEANTVGGRTNLRGHRGDRYAGRSSLYQNTELRIKLATVSSYVAQGSLGVLGFLDLGRVFTDGESSDTWHAGYGGGLWLNTFDAITLTTSYALSEDDTAFTIGMGFQF